MSAKIGAVFQKDTKYQRGRLPRGQLDWANKPETYKVYLNTPQIHLDKPQTEGGEAVWTVMNQRRSVRSFHGEPVTKQELSQLLWASQGITRVMQNVEFRTVPSAGALYPIETYLVVNSIAGIDAGVYHYAVATHTLEQLRHGDFSTQIAQAALDQKMATRADVVFVWTAIFKRSKWKYKQRAYRYVYLDAGHIAQNLALGATALGLGSCQIAALYDDEANALLGVDGEEESVIYMTVIGRDS